MTWLEAHRHEIESRGLMGKTNKRIEVPITNERLKQTYYGAIDLYTQRCLIQATEKGNSEGTIAFLKYLLAQAFYLRLFLTNHLGAL